MSTLDFHQRLDMAFTRWGGTQEDLAEELGLSLKAVGNWLRWTNPAFPSGEILVKLPIVLGCNGHWLLTGEGNRKSLVGEPTKDYLRGFEDAVREAQRVMAQLGEDKSRGFESAGLFSLESVKSANKRLRSERKPKKAPTDVERNATEANVTRAVAADQGEQKDKG